MVGVLLSRIRYKAASWVRHVRAALGEAGRPEGVVVGLVADFTRTKPELVAENAMLRQQLVVASRAVKRPKIKTHERALLVAIASLIPRWREALLLFKPETILRWHRQGFRLFWKHRSRAGKLPVRRVDEETIALIRRMALQNRTWGAERIRGELLKLGIRVAKRTIQRHIRVVRPPGDGQRWRTFLRDHTVWACDFLQTYDVWFRPLFVFFVLDVNTRRVVNVAVTRAPTEQWTAQQIRNATPCSAGPEVLLRDRDSKFGPAFDRAAKAVGVRVVRTAVRTPNMNAVCERFLGSVRRECLDQVIIFREAHLRSVLREYVAYFNASRPHQGLEQHVPVLQKPHRCAEGGNVLAIPVLGGLHHDYRRAA